MSYLFSRVLVEECLGRHCSDTESSVPLKTTPTHGMYWSRGKTTGAFPPSQSGMTYEPLTDESGEAAFTAFLAGFPVRTSASQEEERESKASDPACGFIWRELSVRFDPSKSGWKTPRCSYRPEGLRDGWFRWFTFYSGEYGSARQSHSGSDRMFCESWETLPKWGMMRSGALWERLMLALPTRGIGSGFWRTPDTGAVGTSGLLKQGHDVRANGQRVQVRLVDQVKNKRLCPTPTVDDANNVSRKSGQFQSLTRFVMEPAMFPTPTSALGLGGNTCRSGKRKDELLLGGLVKKFPGKFGTPRASDCKGSGPVGSKSHAHMLGRGYLCAQTATDDSGGSLNPMWVEWLMGWPLGWTDCAKSALAEFKRWFDVHMAEDYSGGWWAEEPDGVGRVSSGVVCRMNRLRCLGNGQVPEALRVADGALKKMKEGEGYER